MIDTIGNSTRGKLKSGVPDRIPNQSTVGEQQTARGLGAGTTAGAYAAGKPEQAKYTFKLNNGETYIMNGAQVDWMKKRYQSTAAASYQDSIEDQIRRTTGKLPTAFEKSYNGTTLDQKLFAQGLPSEKYIKDYIGAYIGWYGDGKTYEFDDQAKTYVADKFKSTWEYEYTFEDQDRKKQGLMPAAIEKKYGDNYRDYTLMQQGLPPELMLSDYVGAYQTIQTEKQRKDEFYLAVTNLALANSANPYNVDDATKQAAFDTIISSSDWADVAALYDTPPKITDDGTVDEIEEYEKKWSAQKKEQKVSDEPTVSYAEFSDQFMPYKARALKEDAATQAAVAAKQSKVTAAVNSNETAKQYINTRKDDDPAKVFAEMYGSGVPLTQINNAKKHWKTLTTDVERGKAIDAAFATVQAQYSVDRAAKKNDGVVTAVEDQYSASANADRYDKETIAAYQADQKRKRQEYRAYAKDRNANNTVIEDALVKPYESGATSTLDTTQAESIFRSHIIYDKNGVATSDSIKLATEKLMQAGVATSVISAVGMKVFDASSRNSQSLQSYYSFTTALKEADVSQRSELIELTRQKIVGGGTMTDFEYDQAVRRAGWSDALNPVSEAGNYYTESYAPKFAENGEQLIAWKDLTDAQQAAFTAEFESGKSFNADVDKSAKEIVTGRAIGAFAGAYSQIASGLVGVADMVTANITGRQDTWQITDDLNMLSAQAATYNKSNQSNASKFAGTTSDIASEIIRMYTLSSIGSGIASMAAGKSASIASVGATATSASTKGLSALAKAGTFLVKSSPFIASSMGQYYSDAMQSGADVQQATLYGVVCGTLEGATEALNTSMWLSRGFGANGFAKTLISGGNAVKAGSVVTNARIMNLVASAIGEFAEESISYVGSWAMQKATYDKNAQFSVDEMVKQGAMGALVGLFGAGLSMGSINSDSMISDFLNTDAGMKWATGEGASATRDLLMHTMVAESLSPETRAKLQMQENALSVEDHDAVVRDSEQHTRQMEADSQKYDTDMGKIAAELTKKQNSVTVLTTKMEQAATDKSAAGMKKWAKIAEQFRVAQSELKVEQAQADAKRTERTAAFTETTEQHKIAISKAQQKFVGHAVSMTEAFAPEISDMGEAAKSGVVPNELGTRILSKMSAARAGKLLDYMQTKAEIQQSAQDMTTVEPLGASHGVQAPTVQEATQNAPDAPTVANQPIQDAGNIKQEGTPANPAEMMGIVDRQSMENVNALRKLGRAAYKRIVSGAAGTERVSRVQKKLDIGGVTLDDSAQGIRDANGTAQYIIADEAVDINGTPIGKSLMALYAKVPQEQWADFSKYWLAKHTEARMTLENRGYGDNKPVLPTESGAVDPDGNPAAMDASEAAALAASLEAKYPAFQSAKAELQSLWSNLMRSWAVDGGLMEKRLFDELRAKYPDYVPTYRVDKNSVGGTSSVTRNSVTISSAIKNATGSTDAIQDIRLSMADLVKRYVVLERRNEMVQNLYSFAEAHPEAAAEYAVIFEIESETPNDVDFTSFDELANQSAAEVKDGQYIIRGYRDGAPIAMNVNKDVYDAINYLTNPSDVSAKANQINEVLRGARAVTKPIKGAITSYNPFFAMMNLFRDTQTYFVNTNANMVDTFTNIGSAISERAKNSELWRSYLALGGSSSGYITSQLVTDASVTGKGKVANAVSKVGGAVSWLGGYTENMFRFAEYINGVNKYGNTAEGRRKAITDSADVTVNFSRSGAWTKAADSFCLYLNANVQGLDKMARTIAKAPGKTALRGLSLAAIALMIRYVSDNDDNPHYQNLTNYVKDSNYVIPNVLGERDENGYCTTFIKIPKSREYGALLIATVERAARFADGESFYDAFADLGTDIGTSVGIRLEPFWSAASAIADNKNYFGSDIVPMYMQGEAAPDQTTAQTSVISDAISERLYEMGSEVSPMLIDYVINQYGGFYGQLLTSATAKDTGGVGGVLANTVKDKFVADPLYQSGVVSRFYDTMDGAQHLARTSERNREKFGISETSRDESGYDMLGDYKAEIAELRRKERKILTKELDTPERKTKIDAIREEINKVAAEGIAAWNAR